MSTQAQSNTTEPGIVLVSVEIGIFGGYKRSAEEDIADAGGIVPDSEVLTKGSKCVFPREKLKGFGTTKKGVNRELWHLGVKALGGGSVLAINEDELPAAEKVLEEGQAEFFDLLAEFWNNYDDWMASYIAANPKEADIIKRSALTREEAVSKFTYRYEMFKPTPVGKNASIESMASKLVQQLYAEVARSAYQVWDVSFNPVVKGNNGQRSRRKVGQKALSPFRSCRDKMMKLAFLNPSINGGVKIIEDVLATMPATGYIEDTPSKPDDANLYALVCLMKDGIKFANAADSVTKGADVFSVLDVGTKADAVGQLELDAIVLAEAAVSKPVVPVLIPVAVTKQDTEDVEAFFF